MHLFALQQAVDEFYPVEDVHWTDYVVLPVILVAAVLFLFWVVRQLKRSMSQNEKVLELNNTAIDLNHESIRSNREAVDVTKQAIELQQENNRLLAELIELLRNRPSM